MLVQFPFLVCIRVVSKNHRTVQCDLCDSWVHIACNNLNVIEIYRKASLLGILHAVFERSHHMGPKMILN